MITFNATEIANLTYATIEDDQVICDKCENYYINGACTVSSCWENLDNPHYLTLGYFRDREDGNKKSCKAFKKLR